ncbi:hypothetical protein CFC21_013020 [Triticum aestivum]|uniref:Bowman-Birk serine protease inhibitors family domain-containing protein n=2 Tax=Triticum aestivum TaxID=4565 RepID=A0A3B5ZYA0_WHEAT|nr:hypothetical protein CFC21_013020 [Triticum aestivum]
MAPRSGAFFLQAAAVAAVLAMLVVPSLGRCHGSPSPAPPPTTSTPPPLAPLPPSPALAPGPSCNDCYSQCYFSCDASISSTCSVYCNVEGACNSCRANTIKECRASKNCAGSCDECNDPTNSSCALACSTQYCDRCRYWEIQKCQKKCRQECSAPKCVP